MSSSTSCGPSQNHLSHFSIAGNIPSHPPPAYPHPPPALTMAGLSQGTVTTTVTTTTATSVICTPILTSSCSPTPSTATPNQTSLARPKRPRNVLTGREARKRLKRHSAVKVYAYYASQKTQNTDILPFSMYEILSVLFSLMRDIVISFSK